MSQTLVLDKFQPAEVPVERLTMRPGSGVPGGVDTISRKLLQNLVRGASEPILVREVGQRMEIVTGDMEYLAAVKRGTAVLKVFVGEPDEKDALLLRLAEGSRRGELNPLEEAEILRALNHDYGMTQQEIAMRTGRVQSTVANKMRLLKLPPEVLKALREGQIGERHARALLKIGDPAKQMSVFRRAVRTRASAQETEAMCDVAAPSTEKSNRGRRKGGRGVVKDIRIYQNGLRSVVREMQKAGLNVTCEEENVETGWKFTVSVRPEGESKR
jgi:ParB family chromosome partitioning protein